MGGLVGESDAVPTASTNYVIVVAILLLKKAFGFNLHSNISYPKAFPGINLHS
jgi:hypothetical protein